ncbi:MAG: mechanosensitive ion channel family protein [Desulfoplanes sp.]|nr:mechanosensitive ion channel family protein [Desulfoplanes sp.]
MEFFHHCTELFASATTEAWLFLAVLCALYAAISMGLHVIGQRLGIAAKTVRFLKWCLVLSCLIFLESWLLPHFAISPPEKSFFSAKAVVIWFVLISFLDGWYVEIYLKKIKHRQVNHIFIDLTKLVLFVILGIVILKFTFDINPGSILTSSAILTAVIGFAMQDTIGSLISGLLIQIEKPFELGDWISVAAHEGKVVEISWRYTKIMTLSKDYILIPNNSISKDTLVNFNRPIPYVRRQTEIGVDFSIPPVRVKAALMEVLEKSSIILMTPAPIVRLIEYGPYRMQYQIIFYVRQFESARRAIDEINTSIWYQFRKEHIPVPYPQSELAVKEYHQREDDTPAIVETVKHIPLFRGMTDENLDLLVRSSYVKGFLHDQAIVRKGATDTTLFVILEGKVEVACNGKKLAEFEAGNFFGEMALLTGEPRSADIKAVEYARCLVVDREGFRMILSASPLIYDNIQNMFNERMLDRNRQGMFDGKKDVDMSFLERFRKIFME